MANKEIQDYVYFLEKKKNYSFSRCGNFVILSYLIFFCCYILVKLSAVDHKISRTYRKNVLLST